MKMKVTEKLYEIIRKEYESGMVSQKNLAFEYNLSTNTIHRIIHSDSYQNYKSTNYYLPKSYLASKSDQRQIKKGKLRTLTITTDANVLPLLISKEVLEELDKKGAKVEISYTIGGLEREK